VGKLLKTNKFQSDKIREVKKALFKWVAGKEKMEYAAGSYSS
jgi:hypothetical protein